MSFQSIAIRNIIILFLTTGAAAWVGVVILGGPAGILAGIAVITAMIIYFYWRLHGRLICLGGEKCLIGVITGMGPSKPLDKGGDNDFTMNLLLASGPTNYTLPNEYYWHSVAQGELVTPNAQIFGIGRGYIQDDGHKEYIVGLHCEFEGDGIYTLLLLAIAILALLIAAAVFPAAALGLLILAAVLFLIGLLGDWLLATPGGPGAGSPTGVDPSLGTMARGDIVVVKGDWVYDSLHPGWNEIHAVHDCQIIDHIDLPDSDALKDPNVPQTPWPLGLQPSEVFNTLDFWCKSMGDAGGAETGGSRQNPQNDWVIHPIIDGCNQVVIV